MNLRHWLRDPRRAVARARYWMWEKYNPDKPWLCPGTVRFLEREISPTWHALEFGSGRSSVWFAGKVAKLTSVEANEGWYCTVGAQLRAKSVCNVDYRLVTLDHPAGEDEWPVYDPIPRYVAAADAFGDGELGLVVVDGHYRTHCVRRSVPKIRPGGLLLVDDVERWPDLSAIPVPADWPVADLSSNGLKQTCVWLRPG